jgi:hypothetical protein
MKRIRASGNDFLGIGNWQLGIIAVATALLVGVFPRPGEGQAYKAPRTASGQPDLNGFWQALNTAHWDLEAHEAAPGPVLQLGAAHAVPPGPGVVMDGPIPYRPDALAMKKKYAADALREDAEIKCYLPGVPRMMYMPYPVQIVQSDTTIMMMSEFASALRTIYMNSTTRPPADTWMYQATIEDPNVYTRPWTISMPLYRRVEPNMQLGEFKCEEFVGDLVYGKYQRK